MVSVEVLQTSLSLPRVLQNWVEVTPALFEAAKRRNSNTTSTAGVWEDFSDSLIFIAEVGRFRVSLKFSYSLEVWVQDCTRIL